VTSERAWPERLSAFLAEVFGLTPAEVALARAIADGGTLTAVAAATRRSISTVRSQLHAVLQKTNTESQADLARLLGLLRRSIDLKAPVDRPEPPP
jgi:DNA-binding NarL/FixJ family response regulator